MLLTDDNPEHIPTDVLDVDLSETSGNTDSTDAINYDDPKIAAIEAAPQALKWIDNAILVLNSCIRSLEPGAIASIQSKVGLPIVRLHFHTDKLRGGSTEKINLRIIESNYQTMRRHLCNSVHIFQSVDDETASLNTLGYFQKDGPLVGAYVYSMKSISFTSHYPTLGPNCKASVIIHELAHYIDARMGHIGGESGPAYNMSDFETAVKNVHCYQNFAIHATPPFKDERYGMNRPNV